MELLVPLALYGWLPIVLVIFRDMPGHRALVATYVAAWLFLPTDEIAFAGLPDYTKSSATSLGVIIAICLFDMKRLYAFRPHWLDLGMLLYCLSPIPSSLSNSLGLWDGCSNTLKIIITWGMPYFFGRLYFDSFDKFRSLAKGIFIGGLVYVPFCLVEVRMSPQIYSWVYGFRPSTRHAFRYGGWRPLVFLSNGLELGMWMTAACLLGFALWHSKSMKKVWGTPVLLGLSALFVTTLMCKSTGSLLLLAGGIGMYLIVRWLRTPWPVILLILVPLTYIPVRVAELSDGREAVAVAKTVFGEERAQSLEFRFRNELMLVRHALDAPWFGWGGWGRELVEDEWGEDISVIDGFWIVTLGKQGLLGMLSVFAAFMIAPSMACFRFARRGWKYTDVGPPIAVALLLLLYMVDCLLNSMANAVYPLCLGALTTICLMPLRQLVGKSGIGDEEQDDHWVPVSRGRLWPPAPDRPRQPGPPGGRSIHLPDDQEESNEDDVDVKVPGWDSDEAQRELVQQM